MASEHRIIRVNDLNPRRTRRKKYRRVYKGDVLRISRATNKSANQVVQEFGLGRNVKTTVVELDLIVTEVKLGHNKDLPPAKGESSSTIPDAIP